MKNRSYTDEALIEAVKVSNSIRQVMILIGIVPIGGNYKTIKKLIEKFGLNTSHFHGKLWNKGKKLSPKREVSEYLENKFPIQSHKLRLRLIQDGLKEHKCEGCGITEWLSNPISLELEHVDGNHENNNLSNLKILCPNCHSQTSTYRGKNKK